MIHAWQVWWWSIARDERCTACSCTVVKLSFISGVCLFSGACKGGATRAGDRTGRQGRRGHDARGACVRGPQLSKRASFAHLGALSCVVAILCFLDWRSGKGSICVSLCRTYFLTRVHVVSREALIFYWSSTGAGWWTHGCNLMTFLSVLQGVCNSGVLLCRQISFPIPADPARCSGGKKSM